MIWPSGLKSFVPGMSGNKLPVFGNKLHRLTALPPICSTCGRVRRPTLAGWGRSRGGPLRDSIQRRPFRASIGCKIGAMVLPEELYIFYGERSKRTFWCQEAGELRSVARDFSSTLQRIRLLHRFPQAPRPNLPRMRPISPSDRACHRASLRGCRWHLHLTLCRRHG